MGHTILNLAPLAAWLLTIATIAIIGYFAVGWSLRDDRPAPCNDPHCPFTTIHRD